MVFTIVNAISLVVLVALLAMELVAFVDCAIRRGDAFPAAGKLTKPGWLLITGLSPVLTWLFPPYFRILGLVGVIASIVYLVDVRPAVKEIGGGRGRW